MIIVAKKHLVLVNVNYFMPDYNSIVQDFFWQTEDYIPQLPRIHKFLIYWKDNINAVINEVSISYERDYKYVYGNFNISYSETTR